MIGRPVCSDPLAAREGCGGSDATAPYDRHDVSSSAGDSSVDPERIAEPGAAASPPEFPGRACRSDRGPRGAAGTQVRWAILCTRRDGDIVPGRASGEGFYTEDTRHLSELRLTVGGVAPVLLSSTMESGHHAIINATNPTLLLDADAEVAQDTINVRRALVIADRLHYGVQLRNFGPRSVRTVVRLSLAADFADVFEVRGLVAAPAVACFRRPAMATRCALRTSRPTAPAGVRRSP